MLRLVFGLLVIALMAGILVFGGIAVPGSPVARMCFFSFVAGFVFAVVWRLLKRRRISPRL